MQEASGAYAPANRDLIISEAKRRLAYALRRGTALNSPALAKEAIQMQLAGEENEAFACLFLDTCHRIIRFETLFCGTINATMVFPRTVIKRILALNAASVIFAHNHPSGMAEPSPADRKITDKLKQALALIDVTVLDHFVVGGEEVYSFAEHGLL